VFVTLLFGFSSVLIMCVCVVVVFVTLSYSLDPVSFVCVS